MGRFKTFLNGIRTMRPFVGRCVPTPEGDVWANHDGDTWGLGFVYLSSPHGHFRAWYLALGTFKVGCYDTN